MFNLTKFPIIIVSNSRAGSSALGYNIQKTMKDRGLDIRYFNEPSSTAEYKEFLEFIKTSNEYILKAHGMIL